VYEQAKQGKVVGIWHRTELASISHPSTMDSFAEYRLTFQLFDLSTYSFFQN
jgi:hypothetical protein